MLKLKFTQKTVLLHGGIKINILIPSNIPDEITAVDEGKISNYIISNGSGYDFLRQLFCISTKLSKNEFIYLPFNFKYKSEYQLLFDGEQHYKGIVILNYCTATLSAKEISLILKTKIYIETVVKKEENCTLHYIDDWKTRNRLSIRKSGLLLIISTNSDGLLDLAYSCSLLSEYGDDIKYNDYPPHMHHDLDENTAKSLGITFYYWQGQ